MWFVNNIEFVESYLLLVGEGSVYVLIFGFINILLGWLIICIYILYIDWIPYIERKEKEARV